MRFFVCLILWAFTTVAQAQSLSNISTILNNAENDNGVGQGFIGFCLMDAQTGEILLERNGGKSFITASTIKIVTTGAALALLGDTFRFKTMLGYKGTMLDSTLLGSLVIKGFGDPTLGDTENFGDRESLSAVSYNLLSAMRSQRIKFINEGIEFDHSVYWGNTIPLEYPVGDLSYYYGSFAQPFNYAANSYSNYSSIDTTYSDGRSTTIANPFLDHTWPRNSSLNYADFYPGRRFVNALNNSRPKNLRPYALLNFEAMERVPFFSQGHKPKPIDNVTWFYTRYSAPLVEVAKQTNTFSLNLCAEATLRAIGTQTYGNADMDTCIYLVKRFWRNEVDSLDGFRMTDGSGIGRTNVCSPKLFCKMLSAYSKRTNFNSFYNSLAIAGQTGTGRKLSNSGARIKSGGLTGVRNYVGYVYDQSGRLLCFAIMFNQFDPESNPVPFADSIIREISQLSK